MAFKKPNLINPILSPVAMAAQNAMKQQPQQAPQQQPKAVTPKVNNPANQYAMGGYGSHPQYINPQDFNETLRKAQYNEPLAIPTGEKNRVYQNYQNLLNLKAPNPDPYKSKYQGNIDSVLDDLLNAKFDYSIDTDPLYEQYKRMYNREGDRAYENALGEASGMTGGRTNTFAMTAAQQAQNYYSTQLNDKVPELYQAAYGRYMDDLANKRGNIGTMSNLDQVDYGRYMDKVNYDRGVYENDRGFYTDNLYRDYEKNYNAYIDDRNFNYGAERDKVADSQWNKQFDRGVLESDRNYNRGVLESDRNYNRGVFESDRNYNRGVLESDRSYSLSASNAALSRERFNYEKEQDKLKKDAAKAAEEGADVNAAELQVIWNDILNAEDPVKQYNSKWSGNVTMEEGMLLEKRLNSMGLIKKPNPLDDYIAGMLYQQK